MKTKIIHRILCIPVGLLLLSFGVSTAQNTQATWSAFDMGFAVSSQSSNTITKSAVGQSFVGGSSLLNNRIEAGFLSGPGLVTGIKQSDDLPTQYELYQNYPNPFNPTTTIRFALPKSGRIDIKLYNVLGQEVTMLLDEEREAGVHHIVVDAAHLASGVYFYRLHTVGFTSTKKLVLVR